MVNPYKNIEEYLCDHWYELAEDYWREKVVPGSLEDFEEFVERTPSHPFWTWATEQVASMAEGWVDSQIDRIKEGN